MGLEIFRFRLAGTHSSRSTIPGTLLPYTATETTPIKETTPRTKNTPRHPGGIIPRITDNNAPLEVTPHVFTGPSFYHRGTGVTQHLSGDHTKCTPVVCGETSGNESSNSKNVEGERNAAASTSARSTTATATVVHERLITSFLRPEQTLSTPAAPSTSTAHPSTGHGAAAAVKSTAAAAGTTTGVNMAAIALAQQPVVDSLAAAFR